MSKASFCWQCSGKLNRVEGQLSYREYLPPGATESVRVHVKCFENLQKGEPEYAQSNLKRDVHRYLGEEE